MSQHLNAVVTTCNAMVSSLRKMLYWQNLLFNQLRYVQTGSGSCSMREKRHTSPTQQCIQACNTAPPYKARQLTPHARLPGGTFTAVVIFFWSWETRIHPRQSLINGGCITHCSGVECSGMKENSIITQTYHYQNCRQTSSREGFLRAEIGVSKRPCPV